VFALFIPTALPLGFKGLSNDPTNLLDWHNNVLTAAVVAYALMDRNDVRLGVSARALESEQPPQGRAKNRVGQVSHGDFHDRKGPGILKPVVLVEGQVPPVQVKIPLRELLQHFHESPHFRAVLFDISSDIVFEATLKNRLKYGQFLGQSYKRPIFSLDRPERIQ
jgi:hypothetical protein